jgi:hypothetical protein
MADHNDEDLSQDQQQHTPGDDQPGEQPQSARTRRTFVRGKRLGIVAALAAVAARTATAVTLGGEEL